MPLTPGAIIRIPVAFKNGEPKYLVVVDVDDQVHCLVINSRIHSLFGSSLAKDSFVSVEISTHPFMHHDCYVDCNEVKRFSTTQVQGEIDRDGDCFKGTVSDELLAQIIEAIEITPFLSRTEKDRYTAALA